MTDSPELKPAKREEHTERDQRLARALRENLRRRKQQARARQQPPTGAPAARAENDPPA